MTQVYLIKILANFVGWSEIEELLVRARQGSLTAQEKLSVPLKLQRILSIRVTQ